MVPEKIYRIKNSIISSFFKLFSNKAFVLSFFFISISIFLLVKYIYAPELALPQPVVAPLEKKSPDSDLPSFVTCQGPFEIEDYVTIEVQDKEPIPKCQRVLAWQKLIVSNKISQAVNLEVGFYVYELKPGDELLIGKSFGELLLPGVHQIKIDYYLGMGPEIWLVK